MVPCLGCSAYTLTFQLPERNNHYFSTDSLYRRVDESHTEYFSYTRSCYPFRGRLSRGTLLQADFRPTRSAAR